MAELNSESTEVVNSTHQSGDRFVVLREGGASPDALVKLNVIPWTVVTGKPTFATVATTGAYSDLTGTPATFPPSAHGHTDATTGAAGFMSAADKTKLDGVAAGAQVNVPTDLAYTAASRLLASSTGIDATLPLVTSTDAGLAPASGGGTTNFLRADGSWAAPAGGGGVLNNFTATTAPTVNEDSGDGYAVGSRWLWAARGLEWVCVSAAVGAARWDVARSGWIDGFIPIAFSNAALGGAVQTGAASSAQTVGTANNNPPQIAAQQTHMQYATAATANNDAGYSLNLTSQSADWVLPSDANPRINPRAAFIQGAFPDASYGSGSTGVRIAVGLNTPQNIVGALGAGFDPNGITAWFRYDTSAGDTNWQFITRSTDQTTSALVVDTGVAFVPGDNLWQFIIIAESAGRLRWVISRLGTSDYSSGVVTTNLPVDRKIQNVGIRIRTLDAVARNMRWSRMAMLERVQ